MKGGVSVEKAKRCQWVKGNRWNMLYHDAEWGVPVHDDRKLFEFLILEGAQAGLSWLTILKRREAYRQAFDNFDFVKIACYNDEKIESLMDNKGIIRNRRKIEAAVNNARRFIELVDTHGSFDTYIWSFVKHKTIQNAWESPEEIPSETDISREMSRELKKKGFKFVGPTICYAFMQATGMVNDHETGCFRHEEIQLLSKN